MQPDEIRCFLRVPRWPWWLMISQTAALPEIRSRLPLLDFPFPQLSQQRGWRFRFEQHRPVLIFTGLDAGASLHLGQHLALFLRNAQANTAGPVFVNQGIDAIQQSA